MTYNAIFNKLKLITALGKLKLTVLGYIGIAILFVTSSTTYAGVSTVTDTFSVTSTVVTTCTVSTTNLAFGNYQFTANSDVTSTINVNCTPGTQYQVGISSGNNSANVATRAMDDGASNLLPYYLYRDASRTQNWGNTPGTDTVDQTANGSVQSITVYGRINLGEVAPAGNYNDEVTVTLSF